MLALSHSTLFAHMAAVAELVQFLAPDARPELRAMAVEYLLGVTGSPE